MQGNIFFNRLKKFYKGEIKIIGSPRYDNFNFVKKKFEIVEINNKQKTQQ